VTGRASSGLARRRLDQWLWFARFAKSRSLASRICTAGAITLNGIPVKKANHAIRIGDIIVFRQGFLLRTIRVLALGARRGPSAEARLLYEQTTAPVHASKLSPPWKSLLADDQVAEQSHRCRQTKTGVPARRC
jgi:ribosome-associated heat shock protein Hsp15